MINPANIVLILRENCDKAGHVPSDINIAERNFAEILWNLIESNLYGRLELHEDVYLYDNENGDSDEEVELDKDEKEQGSSQESEYEPSPVKKPNPTPITELFTMNTMINIVDYHNKHGAKETYKRYSKLNNRYSNLKTVIEYVEKGGNKYSKTKEVKALMYANYRHARDNFLPVHDYILRSWALDAAKLLKLDKFVCSVKFLKSFKELHRITSRKITKFITKKTATNEKKIQESAKNFALEVNQIKTDYNDSNVWNTDQSGFNYELISGRTLSDKGEKDTLAIVKSVNSITHSYTIQVLISNSGTLAPKLFICFQELNGKFGPTVKQRVEANRPENIVVTCTSSGKMTKGTLEYWIEQCLNPLVDTETILIQDSWTGQKDRSSFRNKLSNFDCINIQTIPPGATKYCQPLDVYFFRQYKLFVRRFHDAMRSVSGDEAITRINDRVFIMKMHSFIYNQLRSPVYRDMLYYAWQASGFTIEKELTTFKSVLQVNFDSLVENCSFEGCDGIVLTKCAYPECHKYFCAYHCLKPELHLHSIE